MEEIQNDNIFQDQVREERETFTRETNEEREDDSLRFQE